MLVVDIWPAAWHGHPEREAAATGRMFIARQPFTAADAGAGRAAVDPVRGFTLSTAGLDPGRNGRKTPPG